MDGGRISTLVVLQAPRVLLGLGTAVRETAHVSTSVRIGIVREEGRPLRVLRRAARSPRADAMEVLYCLRKLSESSPASA